MVLDTGYAISGVYDKLIELRRSKIGVLVYSLLLYPALLVGLLPAVLLFVILVAFIIMIKGVLYFFVYVMFPQFCTRFSVVSTSLPVFSASFLLPGLVVGWGCYSTFLVLLVFLALLIRSVCIFVYVSILWVFEYLSVFGQLPFSYPHMMFRPVFA